MRYPDGKGRIRRVRNIGKELLCIWKRLRGYSHDEKTALKRVTSFLTIKSTKTIRALNMLCRKGYSEDALVLGRSIFENLVHVNYIHQARSEFRAKLFERHFLIDFHKKAELYNSVGKSELAEYILSQTKQARVKAVKIKDNECERLKKRREKIDGRQWSCLSLKRMSEKTGLLPYYERFYAFSSLFAHPSSNTSVDYLIPGKSIRNRINDQSGGLNFWLEATLLTSYDVYSQLLEIFARLYCTDKRSEIESIRKKIIEGYRDKKWRIKIGKK